MSGYDVREDDLLHRLPRTEAGLPRAGNVIIQDRLGKGGMGAVYLGRDTKLNVPVAVKVVPLHLVESNPDLVKRFQREAQAAAQVDHPSLMRVYTVDEESGVHYLVLEFVDGESAAERLRREGPLPEADAIEICIAAGEALSAAHAEGIIHRDVKPANVMVRHKDGRVKLADLGLAKSFHEESSAAGGLTATGQVMGTPAYMSPEQAKDASQVDPRTDVYSLGATLYALLIGRAPHDATQLLALLMKVASEEPEELKRMRPELRESTCDVVKRMMAKRSQDRIGTMAGAVAAMKETREALGVSSKGLARPQLAGARGPGAPAAPASAAPVGPAGVGRTLEDVTPADVAGVRRDAATEPAAGPAATAPTVSVAAGTGAGKMAAVALVILAVLGAAGVVGGYLYLQKKAAEREMRITSLVAQASHAELADDLDGAARLLDEAAALGDERARAEAQRVRKTLAERREGTKLLRQAYALSKIGQPEEARSLVVRAIALVAETDEGTELLAIIDGQIARRKAEEERAAAYKKWMDKALELRLSGRLEEAARTYQEAREYAPPGSKEAIEAASECFFEHHRTRAAEAEKRGDLEGAVGLYAKALQERDDPATRRALEAARKKLEMTREAARRLKMAADAERRADLKKALEHYRKAGEQGADVAAKIAALEERLKRLTVSQHGGGPYTTIGAALKDAPPRATITVKPGVYKEGLVLDKHVVIIGDGPREGIVIETTDADCILMKTSYAVVRGLTLRGRAGSKDKKYFAVDIPQGNLVLEDCDITSDSLSCVAIHGESAAPIVRGCRIHDSNESGIFIYDGASGTVEDCDIHGNTNKGVTIKGGDPVIRNCRIYDGKGSGVHVRDGGKATLEDCDIHSNAGTGLRISAGADPTVRRCKIHDGKTSGVFAYDSAKGTLEGCDIYGNGYAGVEIKEGAEPVIRRCRVYDGKQSGVYVNEDGRGIVEDCDIFGNTYGGVAIKKGGDPVVRDCKIHDGKQSGVFVYDNGKGTVEDCDIRGNAFSGVEIKQGGDPVVRKCRINRNGNQGVRVYSDGAGTVKDCDLTGNTKGAWSIAEGCTVKRSGNKE